MNRFPETTKVEAMIAAGGGDGGGANVKSGVSTSPKNTIKQVDFVTAFPSIPNVVIAVSELYCNVWIIEATTTYFKWKNASYSFDAIIHWIATTAGNA